MDKDEEIKLKAKDNTNVNEVDSSILNKNETMKEEDDNEMIQDQERRQEIHFYERLEELKENFPWEYEEVL